MPWTDSNTYNWNGGIYTGGGGCAGFAFAMSDAAFGTLPARILIETSYDAIRPGDILRINNDGHSVIVLQKFGDHVVVAEGNFNSTVHWGRTFTKTELENPDRTQNGSLTYIMTRYPTDPIEHHYVEQSRNGDEVSLVCTDCGQTMNVTLSEKILTFFQRDGDPGYTIESPLYLQDGEGVTFLWYARKAFSDRAIEAVISNENVAKFSNGLTEAFGAEGRIEAVGEGVAYLTVRSVYDNNKVLASMPIYVGPVPSLQCTVEISGEAKSGQKLTAVVKDCNYPEEMISLKWMNNKLRTLGRKKTYTVTDNDIGTRISCAVVLINQGLEESIFSAYTELIQPRDPKDDNLVIAKKTLTLYDTIAITFKIPAQALSEYHDPYLEVTQNGKTENLTNYDVSGDYYVFTYRVAPHNMDDVVTAMPHAFNANNEDVKGVEFTYSVAEYCYNMLGKPDYQSEDYAVFRRLLVDILRYGDAAQIYAGHNVDALASRNLTSAQLAMGTNINEPMTYVSVKDSEAATVNDEDKLASIEKAALYLEATVNIQFKYTANNLSNLRVAVTEDKAGTVVLAEYAADASKIDDNGLYYVTFGNLNAAQMRKTFYATVMQGDKKVSNTYCYSIESYAASMKDKDIPNLDNLLDAMMRYGDSAKIYSGN
ncbi:MAG: hypothetical protein K6F51_10370 [Acetatifactor sp.]|nr:hypothetical protein [Acetatifactor sp.]